MTNSLATYRPSLLGRGVLDDVFNGLFSDFPRHLQQTTQGYPVTDIFSDEDGSTVLEFALAGFSKDELSVNIQPDKRSITVSAVSDDENVEGSSRRIARRSFQKTYVNYDNNLDLANTHASFENGLLTVKVSKCAEIKPLSVKIK